MGMEQASPETYLTRPNRLFEAGLGSPAHRKGRDRQLE